MIQSNQRSQMAETAPIPMSPEERKLYSPERRLFDLEYADIRKVGSVCAEIRQRNGNFWQMIKNQKGELNLESIIEYAKQCLDDTLENRHSRVEESIAESFWGMSEVLGQNNLRRELDQAFQSLRRNSRTRKLNPEEEKKWAENSQKTDGLNMRAAKWTNHTLRTTIHLGSDLNYQKVLFSFWQNFERLGQVFSPENPESTGKLKRGTLGPLAAIRVLEGMGFQVYLPTPEQDSKKATDLLARRERKNGQADRLALQIKSHKGDKFKMQGERLEKEIDLTWLEGREYDEAKEKNKLLTSCQEYSTFIGHLVLPIWIEVW